MNRIAPVSAPLALLAFVAAFAAPRALAADAPKAPTTIRWVLAHTHEDSAYNAVFDEFVARVEKRSAGELKIEFVGKDVAENNRDRASMQMVLDGTADMGQFESGLVNYVPAVTAPFAFRGYAHAEAVFTGPVGKKLLNDLYASSDRKLRALAFTYSGGRRIFFGKSPIAKLSDFKGQRMQSPASSGWSVMMDELMSAVGVQLVTSLPKGTASLDAADQFESVINRGPRDAQRFPVEGKKLKYLNRTNHGLLVTTIVANEKFLAGLPADQRRLLSEEVEALALKERKLSIDLEPERLAALVKLGIQPVELPASERRKLMDIGETVLKKHPDVYRVIQEIRAVKEEAHTAEL